MERAAGMGASDLLAFSKQVRIGDIRYAPQLTAADRAAGDVYVEDALQSLRPCQWRGGQIDAVAA